LAIHLLTGAPIEQLELWIRILLPSFALVLLLYLISITSSSAIGWASVKRIIAGDLALHFYIGAVIIGLIFPIIVVLYSLSVGIASVAPLLLLAAIACGLIGDLTIWNEYLSVGSKTPPYQNETTVGWHLRCHYLKVKEEELL
jgi:surface polysaccharide O-acyltransferase-like enzyme